MENDMENNDRVTFAMGTLFEILREKWGNEMDYALEQPQATPEPATPRRIAAGVGYGAKRAAGTIMIEGAKIIVAVIGLFAALAVAQAGTAMAAGISGFPAAHPTMIVGTVSAHGACLWAWWTCVREAWERIGSMGR